MGAGVSSLWPSTKEIDRNSSKSGRHGVQTTCKTPFSTASLDYKKSGKLNLCQMQEFTTTQTSKYEYQRLQCFIIHDVGKDESGRDTYHCAMKMCASIRQTHEISVFASGEKLLKNMGSPVSDILTYDVDVVIVLITRRLMKTLDDNYPENKLRRDFLEAIKRSNDFNGCMVVPVVLEPHLMDTTKWTGPLTLILTNCNSMGVTDDNEPSASSSSPSFFNAISPTASRGRYVPDIPAASLTGANALKYKQRNPKAISFVNDEYANQTLSAIDQRIVDVLAEVYYPSPILLDIKDTSPSSPSSNGKKNNSNSNSDSNSFQFPVHLNEEELLRNIDGALTAALGWREAPPQLFSPSVVAALESRVTSIAQQPRRVQLLLKLLEVVRRFHMKEDAVALLQHFVAFVPPTSSSSPEQSKEKEKVKKEPDNLLDALPMEFFHHLCELFVSLIQFDKRNQSHLQPVCGLLLTLLEYLESERMQPPPLDNNSNKQILNVYTNKHIHVDPPPNTVTSTAAPTPSQPNLVINPCITALAAMNMLCRYGRFKFTLHKKNIDTLAATVDQFTKVSGQLLAKSDVFDADLMEQICGLIASLATAQDCNSVLWSQGAHHLVAKALKVHGSGSIAVCLSAATALRYLTYYRHLAQAARTVPFACRMLIQVFCKYGLEQRRLAEQVTAALSYLDPRDLPGPHIVQVGKWGFIEALYACIAEHGEQYAAVAQYGLAVVWNNIQGTVTGKGKGTGTGSHHLPLDDAGLQSENAVIWTDAPSHIKKLVSRMSVNLNFPSAWQCPHCRSPDKRAATSRHPSPRKAATPKFRPNKFGKRSVTVAPTDISQHFNTLTGNVGASKSISPRALAVQTANIAGVTVTVTTPSQSRSFKKFFRQEYAKVVTSVVRRSTSLKNAVHLHGSPGRPVSTGGRELFKKTSLLSASELDEIHCPRDTFAFAGSPFTPGLGPHSPTHGQPFSPNTTLGQSFMRTQSPPPVTPSRTEGSTGRSGYGSESLVVYPRSLRDHPPPQGFAIRPNIPGMEDPNLHPNNYSNSYSYSFHPDTFLLLSPLRSSRHTTGNMNPRLLEPRDTANIDGLVEIGACEFICCMMLREKRMTTTYMGGYESWVIRNFCSSYATVLQVFHNFGISSAERCLAMISVISSDNCSNLMQLGELGIADLIVDLALLYGTNKPSIVEQIFWAIGNLARDSSIRVKFGSLGTCEICIAILNHHLTTDVAVVEEALWAIGNLARNNVNARKLGEHNICKLLEAVLVHYGLVAENKLGFVIADKTTHETWAVRVLELCFWCIRVLSWNKKSECMIDFEAVCRPLVLVYARIGAHNTNIGIQGAWAIRNLYFYSLSCADSLCSLGAQGVVDAFKEFYFGSDQIQKRRGSDMKKPWRSNKLREVPFGHIKMKGRIGAAQLS